MLRLKNITKDYDTAGTKVQALKGISIEFRKSEFVSILGQSGCGKTTLLNIIGGLDHYTSGDLIINEKSTKEFKDRDWDAYRNYSIGFVFQSYNLIPHQTILSNVEIALTLSGVPRKERRKRAIKALEQVGLGEQIHKKPNQLSGGQMQRVAIARALVNNPDIILADEPTGALDTKTSVQIMEILKEISKDKLIIMVTHNPELAEKYSTRVVKILDGVITDDSNPYKGEEKSITQKEDKKKKPKTSMNFLTALSLSMNNLLTKKGRTFLTAFAGSIGIIGIALILSLSSGVRNYIAKVEEDTLSEYPITIAAESVDMSTVLTAMMDEEEETAEEKEVDKIYSKNIMTDMISSVSQQVQTNNLEELKKYLDTEGNVIRQNSNAIQYSYNIPINVYKADTENGIVQVNPSSVMDEIMGTISGGSSYTGVDVWEELLDNKELLESQYTVLAGHMPVAYNQVVLIVGEENEISDYTLYSLGIRDVNELKDKMNKIKNGEEVEEDEEQVFSYEDLLNLKFKLLLNSDIYEKQNGLWIDMSDDEEFMKSKLENAVEIDIVGIIKVNPESTLSSNSTGIIGYTKDLTTYVINNSNEAEIVKEQKENQNINVFTGMEFSESSKDDKIDYESLTDEQKSYISSLSQEELAELMKAYSDNAGATYETNLELLGVVDLNSPARISIYPKDFESKDLIKQDIENYNKKWQDEGKEENVINYTDLVGTIMSSVTTIINIISYVLIAFVAISLVVSSIMIGIITYISVLERIKEIGILRAVGASKKDISRVFRAETFIEGVFAGILGIAVTLLLNIPINAVIKLITGISGISQLPTGGAIILVIISILLTVIAGGIPAKIAAKKDPVEALRTE